MKKKWFFENLREEALKHKTKNDFRLMNPSAYLAATRRADYDLIVEHMPKYLDSCGENGHNFKWTNEMLRLEALKFQTRGEFQKYSKKAYKAALMRGILDEICSHMEYVRIYWTYEMLKLEALKYKTRSEFSLNSSSAYVLAKNRGILDEICAHMEKSRNISKAESYLFDIIKSIFPKTQILKDKKVKIEGKYHIQGFDIDIYIPELRKGIEFDGKYWHSESGLRRSRKTWPQEDIDNYHQLKDDWFKIKGIQILHIAELDWKNNRPYCIAQIEQFLGITGLMAEQKAA